MKKINKSKTLELEDFKIVGFQDTSNEIRGGFGWLCGNKPPTSGPTMPDPPDDPYDGVPPPPPIPFRGTV